MNKLEKNILKNSDFVRKLREYTHESYEERIWNAWMDSDEESYMMTEDESYNDDFLQKCIKIIEKKKEE